jgi:AcrR family transcriptional regulator
MGVQERRERARTELREKILDAARVLFAREGYDAVSMRRIAEVIEYSPTAIYVHFADKESLMRELCANDFQNFGRRFNALRELKDPIQRIRAAGETYIRFGIENPNHYRLMFMTPISPALLELDEESQSRRGVLDVDGYAFLRHAIVEALESSRFRAELNDPDLIAQTLWAAVHGAVALQIIKAGDPWHRWPALQHRIELILDAILRGLTRDGATGRDPARRDWGGTP